MPGASPATARPPTLSQWASAHSPALQTPGAKLFAIAGLSPAPVGVRQARAALRANGCCPRRATPAPQPQPSRAGRRRRNAPQPALALRGVWHELRDGPAILRGVDLALAPGETRRADGPQRRGKSTLLRHAAGLLEPTRGRIERAGRVALLLQNPGDYFIHERVARGDLRRRRSRRPASGAGRAPPARPLRRRAPAPGAGDRDRTARGAGGARAG